MDEGGGLENRYTGDCIVGSNPTPSARISFKTWAIYALLAGQKPKVRDRISTGCPITFSLTRLLGTNPATGGCSRGFCCLVRGGVLGFRVA